MTTGATMFSGGDGRTSYTTCRFIETVQPTIFTLENVWGYRKFVAFEHIIACLRRNGYEYSYWHLNSADYGVPQTRKRLILVARLDGIPHKPEATHAKNPSSSPVGLKRWVGWYEAIEDLIPTLPESHFAEWQLRRLPEFCNTTTVDGAGYPDSGGGPGPVR